MLALNRLFSLGRSCAIPYLSRVDEGLPGTGRFPHYILVSHSILLRFLLFYGSSFVGFYSGGEVYGGFPIFLFLTLKKPDLHQYRFSFLKLLRIDTFCKKG